VAAYRTLGLTVPVSELLDPTLWRQRYAWGIPLAGMEAFTPKQQLVEACQALNEGDLQQQVQSLVAQIPDDVVRWHLRTAISELEMQLQIPMGIVVVKSPELDPGIVQGRHFDRLDARRPWTRQAAMQYYKLELPYSVISIERVRGYLYGRKIIEASRDAMAANTIGNIVLEWPSQGGAHILPIDLSAIITGPGYTNQYALSMWELIWRQGTNILPDFWALDYTIGPRDKMTGTPGQIEVILAHWVYLRAGKFLINMAGTAYGQGIASTSLSMDGFTRSVTTSQSAMYGINSAMELVMQGMIDSIDWERLRRMKRGLKVYAYGG
jgi:hypothetical protein